MKYLKLKEQLLNEINMSPNSLRRAAAEIGARAGMEFEMIVPGAAQSDDDPEWEADYDRDEATGSFSDIRDFFHDGDYNGRRQVDNLMDELVSEYEEWMMEQTAEAWERDGVDFITDYISVNDLFDRDEAMDEARKQIIDANPDLPEESEDFSQLLTTRLDEMEREFAQAEYENQGKIYNDAFEEFTDEQRDEYDERTFLDDKYPNMSDIQNHFDISWPHYIDLNDGQGGDVDIEQVADEFSSAIGREVKASSSYHSSSVSRPSATSLHYVVEPDGSLEGDEPGDGGLEFVSPALPLDELLLDLKKVKAWADNTGAYTNDSTGLHINVSVPNWTGDLAKLDFVKLAILMGDEYVLEEFGRSGNTYAKSAMKIVKDHVKQRPEDAELLLSKMKEHLNTSAAKVIHSGTTSKYTSINTKTGYIEFRSPGGDWLNANFDKIESTLLRFVVAMDAAVDETKYKEEYAKKLYKILAPGSDEPSTLQLFVNYSSGELDKESLIRQVRQQQLSRDVAKGKGPAGQKYWWNVQWDANRRIEVVALDKQQAREVAAKEWSVPVEQLAIAKVTMLRPYEAPVPRSAAENQGNWGIWISASDRFAREPNTVVADNVLRRFPSQQAAEQFLAQTREQNPRMRTDVEVREIPSDYELPNTPVGRPVAAAEPIPGSTLDLQRQRAMQGQQTFTGEWKIVDANDREIHRFGGIGNAQSDANRVAMNWLRQNPRHMQSGVQVLPVMS